MGSALDQFPVTTPALLYNIGDVLELGVLTLDSDRRILGWNRWLEINSGIQAQSVLGRELGEVFPDFVGGAGDRALKAVFGGATVVLSQRFHEYFLRFPPPPGEADFSCMQQSVRIVPYIENGKVAGAIALIEDVTERVARDRELRQALRDAQGANRAKADFLASMSHELRTPLAGISGYTDLLIEEIAGPLNDAQKQHLKRVKDVSQHVLALVDEILTFTRLQAGREQIDFEEILADDIVRAAAFMVEPNIAARKLQFDVRIEDGPVKMVTDQRKVRQILVNLLGNAAKFVEQGSVCLTLSAPGAGDTVRFEVADTGPGITPENAERVFEPFTQVDTSLTRRSMGTGLGLPLSRQMAKLLGGDLELQSAVGQGSTFTLVLPRRPRELANIEVPRD